MEEKQTELILLYVDHSDFREAAGVYLDLVNKGILLDILSLELCQKILQALLDLDNKSEASKLAMVVGDTYAKAGKLAEAEPVYRLGYDNDVKNRTKYQSFVTEQTALD